MANWRIVGNGPTFTESWTNNGAFIMTVRDDYIKFMHGDGTISILRGSGFVLDESTLTVSTGIVISINHYAQSTVAPWLLGALIDRVTGLSGDMSLIDPRAGWGIEQYWLGYDDDVRNLVQNPLLQTDHTFQMSWGDDVVYAGGGNDRVSGLWGNDRLFGQNGNDVLDGGFWEFPIVPSGDDYLGGGAGDDKLFGRDGADTLIGGTGADTVYGGSDNDILRGQDGDDVLDGGEQAMPNTESGDDMLLGGNGNDLLIGRDGADKLYGGADNDTLSGGSGNDTVVGGAGDDSISGDGGNDHINGGDGQDVLFILENLEDLTININNGRTTFTTASGERTVVQGVEAIFHLGGVAVWNDFWQEWTPFGSAEQGIGQFWNHFAYLDAGLDFIVRGNYILMTNFFDEVSATIIGHDYNDLLYGDENDQSMFGGRGRDTLNGKLGNDILDGGDGIDTAAFANFFGDLVIVQDADGFIVTSSEGTDLLRNIERIEAIEGTFEWNAGLGEWQSIF
jgi:Ca2+-binding RTX toxin-like protein